MKFLSDIKETELKELGLTGNTVVGGVVGGIPGALIARKLKKNRMKKAKLLKK